MFVSIGYLLLTVTRWIRYQWTYNMYRNMFKKVVETTSVYISTELSPHSSVGGLIRSPLLCGTLQYQDTPLLHQDGLQMVTVQPQQMVQLSDWTSYYRPNDVTSDGQSTDTHTDTRTDTVIVLLEAVRPPDIDHFLKHELDTPPSHKVHLLAHGTPIAWRHGSPFGILLSCTLNEFTTLAMAYVDGSLTLDEDLQVQALLTVKTEGKSSSLLRQEVETDDVQAVTASDTTTPVAKVTYRVQGEGDDSNIEDIEHLAADLARTLSGEHDHVTELWSNESQASNSSIGRVDMLGDQEEIGIDCDDDDIGMLEESGSGEGLSEMDFPESSGNSGSLADSWTVLHTSSASKPPNILVYTGKIDLVRKFDRMKQTLEQCLDSECYVIYHLKHEDLHSPWIDNTALLVIATKKSYTDANEVFFKYFKSGGKILGFACGFDTMLIGQMELRPKIWISEVFYKTWTDVSLIMGRYAYSTDKVMCEDVTVNKLGVDKDKNVVVVKVTQNTKATAGCAILGQILFERDASDVGITPEIFNTLKKSNVARFEILSELLTTLGLECNRQTPPTLTPIVLITQTQELKQTFMKSIQSRLSSGVLKSMGQSLLFTTDKGVPVKENLLPVLTEDIEPVCSNFSIGKYQANLDTRVLGNTVLYTDVVPTTMTLLDGLMFSVPKETGLIAIARQQTSGKGRGGNCWLSPVGCAMFTLHVTLPVDSNLGRCLPFLQHITSLAVVYSVNKIPGYQDIDLRLKWPNDIYYGREMKLGGVIVKSTIMDGMVHATIGCGFNVDNSNPTICINDLIQLYNRQQGTNLESCSTEQLVARTVTHIESLVQHFQTAGVESFRQMYCQKWLHSNSKVILQSEGNIEVTILGLDDFGFLLVETSSGEQISVQPDGNSFDMMQNLISLKTR